MSNIILSVREWNISGAHVPNAEAVRVVSDILQDDALYWGTWVAPAQADAEARDLVEGLLPGETMRAGSEYGILITGTL